MNSNFLKYYGCVFVSFEAGNDDLVRVLIGVGAEVDSADRKCQTPLYSAVFNLHTSTSFLLLEKGANPEGNSKHLNTPLQIAIMHKNAAILKVRDEFIYHQYLSNCQLLFISFLMKFMQKMYTYKVLSSLIFFANLSTIC